MMEIFPWVRNLYLSKGHLWCLSRKALLHQKFLFFSWGMIFHRHLNKAGLWLSMLGPKNQLFPLQENVSGAQRYLSTYFCSIISWLSSPPPNLSHSWNYEVYKGRDHVHLVHFASQGRAQAQDTGHAQGWTNAHLGLGISCKNMHDSVREAAPEAEGTNQCTAHIITSWTPSDQYHTLPWEPNPFIRPFLQDGGEGGRWGSQGAEGIPRRRTKPRLDTSGSFLGKWCHHEAQVGISNVSLEDLRDAHGAWSSVWVRIRLERKPRAHHGEHSIPFNELCFI